MGMDKANNAYPLATPLNSGEMIKSTLVEPVVAQFSMETQVSADAIASTKNVSPTDPFHGGSESIFYRMFVLDNNHRRLRASWRMSTILPTALSESDQNSTGKMNGDFGVDASHNRVAARLAREQLDKAPPVLIKELFDWGISYLVYKNLSAISELDSIELRYDIQLYREYRQSAINRILDDYSTTETVFPSIENG
jgi:hypothetical protein